MQNSKHRWLWNLGQTITIDDDQQPWKGWGGGKSKNNCKAHGIGITSYKGVDNIGFCIASYFPKDPAIEAPLSQGIVQLFNNRLKENVPYTICVDAGPLGSIAHADIFGKSNRNYLFSF